MTSYTRSPKKAVAKCPVAGCKWIRIYFDFQEMMPCELRAEKGLKQHQRMKHGTRVLINGR